MNKLISVFAFYVLLSCKMIPVVDAQMLTFSHENTPNTFSGDLLNNNIQESDEKISVVTFLNDIEKQYDVWFLYENDVLEDKKVNADWKSGEELNVILKENLYPQGLQFKQIGEKQIIIYPGLNKLGNEKLVKNRREKEPERISLKEIPVNISRLLLKRLYKLDTIRHIEGRVTSADDGKPLEGVSVVVKGSNSGTITDESGHFDLDIPGKTRSIVFQYVGFQSQEVLLSSEEVYQIQLKNLTEGLDEVVVVAYGTQSKGSLTGSVGTVKPEAYQDKPRENFVKSLQGNVAGVRATIGNGQPGAGVNVHIRGKGSINASSAPLYVVDGVPISTSTGISYGAYGGYTTSGLAGINPNDIASISVLKDAAATSIYGSRAANGVVLITTKSGKSGKPRINLSIQHGINKMSLRDRNRPLNTSEMLELLREGWKNAGKDPADFVKEIEKQGIDTTQNTDWLDAITRTGSFSQYNLSVSGGSEKTQYMASGSYYDTKATLKGLDYQKGTARMKLRTQPVKRVNLNAGLSGYYQKTLGAQRTSSYYGSPVRKIYRAQPWIPVYNPDGSYNLDDFTSQYNPLAEINETTHEGITYEIRANAGAQIDLLKGLTFETKESFALIYGETNMFFPGFFGWGRNVNGRGYARTSLYKIWTTSNLLRYKQTFQSGHHLETYAGYEAQNNLHTGAYMTATDFIPNLETLVAASTPTTTETTNTEHSITGAFLHANYNYKEDYFFSASFRRDGSSRFGAKRRFANFWSIGLGWNVYNTILNGAPFISALKVRSSYGTSGNQGIGNYESTGRYGSGYDYAGHAGYAFTQYENPLLTWEQNQPFDVGMDFGLFEDRLTGTIDYYVRNTTNLLFDRPIPATSGQTSYTVNFGSMRNSGWEITLSSRNIMSKHKGGFNWNTDFNISTLKNVITKLPETSITDHYIREVGGDYYTWYMQGYAGADPETGERLYYSSEDKSETTTDYNKAVRIKMGTSVPKFYGGLTNTLNYKNFTFSFLLYFSGGNKLYDLRGTVTNSDGAKGFGSGNKLSRYTYDNRWQKPGDKTDVPKMVFNGEASHRSTRWLADGDFVRLRDISLSYNIPGEILTPLKIQSANIYIMAHDLFTYIKDDRLMFDPEQSVAGQGALRTPKNKTIVAGIDISF